MNLVFKYNWDHRPIPLNTGQGRLQFSLPFASGIPNLAPSFSQVQGTATVEQGGTGAKTPAEARANLNAARSGANEDITELKGLTTALSVAQGGTGATTVAGARSALGLGDAATKNVGENAGNVMEVGAFGLGGLPVDIGPTPLKTLNRNELQATRFLANSSDASVDYGAGLVWKSARSLTSRIHGLIGGLRSNTLYHVTILDADKTGEERGLNYSVLKTSANTQVDSNGFLKAASPVVDLYADHIELNNEAQQQAITFERIDTGNYLIRNSSGFAQEGWYIEVPKDARGNVLVSVEYTTLENGDLSIKTYKKTFDFETASIVSDLDHPLDIPEGRFISLRLQELPQPEIEEDLEPESIESEPTESRDNETDDPPAPLSK